MHSRRAQEFFPAERFPDGMSVSTADVTTCYPGQPPNGSAAHDGVSVTVIGSENERAQSINRQQAARKLNGSRAVFRKVLWGLESH